MSEQPALFGFDERDWRACVQSTLRLENGKGQNHSSTSRPNCDREVSIGEFVRDRRICGFTFDAELVRFKAVLAKK